LVFVERLSKGVIYLRISPETLAATHEEFKRVLSTYSEPDRLRLLRCRFRGALLRVGRYGGSSFAKRYGGSSFAKRYGGQGGNWEGFLSLSRKLPSRLDFDSGASCRKALSFCVIPLSYENKSCCAPSQRMEACLGVVLVLPF
jgi:hypothetical protein